MVEVHFLEIGPAMAGPAGSAPAPMHCRGNPKIIAHVELLGYSDLMLEIVILSENPMGGISGTPVTNCISKRKCLSSK